VALNRSYATNGLNQYATVGGTGFTYDPNGNLTSDGSTTFTYDIENRLVSASGAKSAGLVYDPMGGAAKGSGDAEHRWKGCGGRLFQLTGPSSNNRFLYDGDELVAEYDYAGSIANRYVHSDNGLR